jgi:hypothetical protein
LLVSTTSAFLGRLGCVDVHIQPPDHPPQFSSSIGVELHAHLHTRIMFGGLRAQSRWRLLSRQARIAFIAIALLATWAFISDVRSKSSWTYGSGGSLSSSSLSTSRSSLPGDDTLCYGWTPPSSLGSAAGGTEEDPYIARGCWRAEWYQQLQSFDHEPFDVR